MSTIALDALLAHTPECDPNNKYRDWCKHDDLLMGVREYLIMGEDYTWALADEYAPEVTPEIVAAVDQLNEDEHFNICLEMSLCPMHTRDYASCFDDEDPECAAIREEYPEHDT